MLQMLGELITNVVVVFAYDLHTSSIYFISGFLTRCLTKCLYSVNVK